MTSELLAENATQVRRVARAHGARRLRVFGSHARGDDTPASDVDLIVRLDPGRDLIDLVALRQDLETLLGRSVDVVEEGGLSPYLRDAILRDARPL
jgi:predicted nucleotidyltransferase